MAGRVRRAGRRDGFGGRAARVRLVSGAGGAGPLGAGHARHLGESGLEPRPRSVGLTHGRRCAHGPGAGSWPAAHRARGGGARAARCEPEHFNHRFGGWDAQERPGGRDSAICRHGSSRGSRALRRGSRDELQPRVAIAREPARPGLPSGAARAPSPRCLAPQRGSAPGTPVAHTPQPRRAPGARATRARPPRRTAGSGGGDPHEAPSARRYSPSQKSGSCSDSPSRASVSCAP